MKFWLKNALAKFIKNTPEFWEESFDSGYWDLLNSPDQLGRHYVIAGVLKELLPEEGNILDVGCGYGTILPLLKGSHFSYTGIDIAQAAIARCRAKYANENKIQFQQTKFENLDTHHKYDAVILNEVLYYLPLRSFRNIMEKVSQLLKGESSLLIVSMTQNPKAVFLRNWHFRKTKPLRHLSVGNLGKSGKWAVVVYPQQELNRLLDR